MRAKILSSSSTFNGVDYNTDKSHNGKGELTRLRNFGYLQDSSGVTPSEVKNVLTAHSNRNSIVKDKQFHAMISCKGREYTKEELTDIAHEWVDKMGYGSNPFLIVFHKDTANNHVHIVSSRIDKCGKKINDSFEKVRAQEAINEIMRLNPKHEAKKAADTLKEFSFSTKAQGHMILENLGFKIREKGEQLELIKYGSVQWQMPSSEITQKTKAYKFDKSRAAQLTSILDRYSKIYNSYPFPLYEPSPKGQVKNQIGYRSDLADFIKDKFSVQLVFHGKDGKTPYGYSIVDQPNKIIFKGSEVFPIQRFFDQTEGTKSYDRKKSEKALPINLTSAKVKLRSALHDFPTLRQGIEHHSIHIGSKEGNPFLKTSQGDFQTKDILTPDQQLRLSSYLMESGENLRETNQKEFGLTPLLDIANDVDDEAVHGRKRSKKRNGDNEISR